MRPHNNGAKLRRRRRAEERSIEAAAVGLLVEWTLHESVWNHSDNRAPWQRLSRIVYAHSASELTGVTKMFSRKAGIHDRHRLFRVTVLDREVAAFQNL